MIVILFLAVLVISFLLLIPALVAVGEVQHRRKFKK